MSAFFVLDRIGVGFLSVSKGWRSLVCTAKIRSLHRNWSSSNTCHKTFPDFGETLCSLDIGAVNGCPFKWWCCGTHPNCQRGRFVKNVMTPYDSPLFTDSLLNRNHNHTYRYWFIQSGSTANVFWEGIHGRKLQWTVKGFGRDSIWDIVTGRFIEFCSEMWVKDLFASWWDLAVSYPRHWFAGDTKLYHLVLSMAMRCIWSWNLVWIGDTGTVLEESRVDSWKWLVRLVVPL